MICLRRWGGRAALEKVSTAKLLQRELWRCWRRPSRAPSQVRQSYDSYGSSKLLVYYATRASTNC